MSFNVRRNRKKRNRPLLEFELQELAGDDSELGLLETVAVVVDSLDELGLRIEFGIGPEYDDEEDEFAVLNRLEKEV